MAGDRACATTFDLLAGAPLSLVVLALWIPLGFGLTILGLRWAKALLITQEYIHRAREGRIAKK